MLMNLFAELFFTPFLNELVQLVRENYVCLIGYDCFL